MLPLRLMEMSDQPILELLVRSTGQRQGQSQTQYWHYRLRDGTRRECCLTFVVLPLVDTLKVVDPSVVVVLARKDNSVEIAGVGIGNGVTCQD